MAQRLNFVKKEGNGAAVQGCRDQTPQVTPQVVEKVVLKQQFLVLPRDASGAWFPEIPSTRAADVHWLPAHFKDG